MIEVQHPENPTGVPTDTERPVIRFGVFGAGRPVKQEMLRHDFASRYGIQAFDAEFDQVIIAWRAYFRTCLHIQVCAYVIYMK